MLPSIHVPPINSYSVSYPTPVRQTWQLKSPLRNIKTLSTDDHLEYLDELEQELKVVGNYKLLRNEITGGENAPPP